MSSCHCKITIAIFYLHYIVMHILCNYEHIMLGNILRVFFVTERIQSLHSLGALDITSEISLWVLKSNYYLYYILFVTKYIKRIP